MCATLAARWESLQQGHSNDAESYQRSDATSLLRTYAQEAVDAAAFLAGLHRHMDDAAPQQQPQMPTATVRKPGAACAPQQNPARVTPYQQERAAYRCSQHEAFAQLVKLYVGSLENKWYVPMILQRESQKIGFGIMAPRDQNRCNIKLAAALGSLRKKNSARAATALAQLKRQAAGNPGAWSQSRFVNRKPGWQKFRRRWSR